jgi:hypothetical protein
MDGRARLMLAALGFLRLEVWPENMPPALLALHRWLDSWVALVPSNAGWIARTTICRSPATHDSWVGIGAIERGGTVNENEPVGVKRLVKGRLLGRLARRVSGS